MPIYEYKCSNCGNQLEIMQRISEDPLTECPRCQGKLEKQWSLSGFQFKGSGWYVSDYGKRDSAAESKAEGGSEAKSESKTDNAPSENKSTNNEKQAESSKSSASSESTAATPGASQPANAASETKPIAKTD